MNELIVIKAYLILALSIKCSISCDYCNTNNQNFIRMEKATAALEFFSTRQWKWDTNNMEDLEKSLQPGDRKIFGMVKHFGRRLIFI